MYSNDILQYPKQGQGQGIAQRPGFRPSVKKMFEPGKCIVARYTP